MLRWIVADKKFIGRVLNAMDRHTTEQSMVGILRRIQAPAQQRDGISSSCVRIGGVPSYNANSLSRGREVGVEQCLWPAIPLW